MPNTKPDLHFDENYICDACRTQSNKNLVIDWNQREQEFLIFGKKI